MHKTSRKSLQDASGVGVVLATKRQNAAGASCAFCQAASSLVTAKRRVVEQGGGGGLPAVWLPNVTFQRLNLPSSGCCNPIKNSSWKCREKRLNLTRYTKYIFIQYYIYVWAQTVSMARQRGLWHTHK